MGLIGIYSAGILSLHYGSVNGESMLPTLKSKQWFVYQKTNYCNVGDIVIANAYDKAQIKRVVGVSGDSIVIKDRKLYINNKFYKNYNSNNLSEKIEEGNVFLLSDNPEGYDSRAYGQISLDSIEGRVLLW